MDVRARANPTEDLDIAVSLAGGDESLCEFGGLEFLLARARLGVELPDVRALVQNVHVALDDTCRFCSHLTDDEGRFVAVLGKLDEVELVEVERGRVGDMVEARGNSTTKTDEVREIG